MSVHYVCSRARPSVPVRTFCERRAVRNRDDHRRRQAVLTISRFPELAQHRIDGIECSVDLFSDLYNVDQQGR